MKKQMEARRDCGGRRENIRTYIEKGLHPGASLQLANEIFLGKFFSGCRKKQRKHNEAIVIASGL